MVIEFISHLLKNLVLYLLANLCPYYLMFLHSYPFNHVLLNIIDFLNSE